MWSRGSTNHFLFLHLHPPHIPNILYEKNRKDYAMKIYNERLQIADAALGKILKVLDQSPKIRIIY